MTPETVMDIYAEALLLAMTMVVVIVGPSLVVGLMVSTFQAATQINEQTLSFLPRFIVTLAAIMMLGAWHIEQLTGLFIRLVTSIPQLVG